MRTARLDVEAADDFIGLGLEAFQANPTAFAQRLRARKQQVVRQAQRGHCAAPQPLLGHKVHSQRAPRRGAQPRYRLAKHLHHASLRPLVFARERIEQLALAVARHACNAHHLARAHVQRNGVQVHAKLVFTREAERLHAQHRLPCF